MMHNDRDAAQHDRIYDCTALRSRPLCLEHGDGRTDPGFVRPIPGTSLQKETDIR